MFELDPDERPFFDAVLADPDDATARLVYADWLEERGDERAEFLRLELGTDPSMGEYGVLVQRNRLVELADQLEPGWIALVVRDPKPVAGCPRGPEPTRCPREWDNLESTRDSSVRACHECGSPVYFCRSRDETLLHDLTGDAIVTPGFIELAPSGDFATGEDVDAERARHVAERLGPQRMADLVARRKRARNWTNPFNTSRDDG